MIEQLFQGELLPQILKVGLGSIALFVGLLLWSKTREPGWILVVISTLTLYVQILLTSLGSLNILSLDTGNPLGTAVLRLVIDNLYMVFLIAGILFAIREHR